MSYQAQHVKPAAGKSFVQLRTVVILVLSTVMLTGLMTAGAFWYFRPAKRVVTYLQRGDYEQAVTLFNTKLSRYAKSSSGKATAAFLKSVGEIAEGDLSYEEAASLLKIMTEADSDKITQAASDTWLELASAQISEKLAEPDYTAAVAIYNSCRSENLADTEQDALMESSIACIVDEYSQGELSYDTAESYLEIMTGLQHYDLAQEAGDCQRSMTAGRIAELLGERDYRQAAELYEKLEATDEQRAVLEAAWITCADELSDGWRDGSVSTETAEEGLTLIAGLENSEAAVKAQTELTAMKHETEGLTAYEQALSLQEAGSYAEAMLAATGVREDCTAYENAQLLYAECKETILNSVSDPATSEECEAFLESLRADAAVIADAELEARIAELEEEEETLKAAEEEAARQAEEEARRQENDNKNSCWSGWSDWSGWDWFRRWF